MRDYVDQLRRAGQLVTVRREVDPEFELAAVTRAVQQRFDRVRGRLHAGSNFRMAHAFKIVQTDGRSLAVIQLADRESYHPPAGGPNVRTSASGRWPSPVPVRARPGRGSSLARFCRRRKIG